MLRDSPARFGSVSKGFHWALTLLVIGMLTLGWIMASLPEHSPVAGTLVGLHKSSGLLVLFLAMLYILWRVANRRPPLADLPPWQRYLALFTHVFLFIILVVQPLAGILMSMASGHAVDFYGLFTLPMWAPHSKPLAGAAHDAHAQIIPWVIVGLVAVHLCGALYHQFVRKDTILWRMLPGTGDPRPRER